jgi:hypothetical protein
MAKKRFDDSDSGTGVSAMSVKKDVGKMPTARCSHGRDARATI